VKLLLKQEYLSLKISTLKEEAKEMELSKKVKELIMLKESNEKEIKTYSKKIKDLQS